MGSANRHTYPQITQAQRIFTHTLTRTGAGAAFRASEWASDLFGLKTHSHYRANHIGTH